MNVVLIGGFACPPLLLRPLVGSLQAAGHEVRVPDVGWNVDCGEATVQRVERLVAELECPVALMGHSRGGQIARVVAVRSPHRIDRLVTVMTPWSVGPPAGRAVEAVSEIVRGARRRGYRGFGSIDCARGRCCQSFRASLVEKPSVRWIALWSSSDRIAGDDGRPPQCADVVRDTGLSHVGAVSSTAGRRALVESLAL